MSLDGSLTGKSSSNRVEMKTRMIEHDLALDVNIGNEKDAAWSACCPVVSTQL